MIKRRPVVVLVNRGDLCTVVPLSTTEPSPIEDYHYQIPPQSLPDRGKFHSIKSVWLKRDMVYTLGHYRLQPILLGRTQGGRREYFKQRLGREQMKQVYSCVLKGLNLSKLPAYL